MLEGEFSWGISCGVTVCSAAFISERRSVSCCRNSTSKPRKPRISFSKGISVARCGNSHLHRSCAELAVTSVLLTCALASKVCCRALWSLWFSFNSGCSVAWWQPAWHSRARVRLAGWDLLVVKLHTSRSLHLYWVRASVTISVLWPFLRTPLGQTAPHFQSKLSFSAYHNIFCRSFIKECTV